MPLSTIGYWLLPFVLLPLVGLSVFTCCLCVMKASARVPERLCSLRLSHVVLSGSGRRPSRALPPGAPEKRKTNPRSALESAKVLKNEPETNPNEPELTPPLTA